MLYAFLQDSIVSEIIESDDIDNQYHPDFVAQLVKCDKSVCVGMAYDGKKFVEVVSQNPVIDKAVEQYAAIDAHIAVNIKSNGYDYDNIGELAAYMFSNIDNYRVEARAIFDWVEKCQLIQTKIKTGELKFDSVDDAIATLPKFEILD